MIMDFFPIALVAWLSITYVLCVPQDDIYKKQIDNQWFKDGLQLTQKNFLRRPNTNPAKNVILFIGDGMGVTTTTAARIFDGQTKGQPGEENVLSWEKFPYTALAKTYNIDAQVPDSAGTATAFAAGVKTRKSVLGVNENVKLGDCKSSKGNEVLSILTFAELAGLSTGLITTTRVTHATPAAFFCHSASRAWENDQAAQGDCKDISRQLIEYPYGDGLEVALGGGWRSFLPCGSIDPDGKLLNNSKCRKDGRNLTNEWLEKYNNSALVWNKEQLKNVDANKVDHLLGLFSTSGMEYEVSKKSKNRTSEPSLVEMVEKAVQILSRNPKGFFLMAEGGLIDWGHHATNAHKALSETVAMAKAVERVQEIMSRESKDETLIIVTADHGHAFAHYGPIKRGDPILGFQNSIALDGKPALALSYGDGSTGLTWNGTRGNLTGLTEADYNDTEFLQQSLVLRPSESHGAQDVGIHATGPFAHLFHGVVEQNYIFHVMDYALCLTESKQEYCVKPHSRGGPAPTSSPSGQTNSCLSWGLMLVALLNFCKMLGASLALLD